MEKFKYVETKINRDYIPDDIKSGFNSEMQRNSYRNKQKRIQKFGLKTSKVENWKIWTHIGDYVKTGLHKSVPIKY